MGISKLFIGTLLISALLLSACGDSSKETAATNEEKEKPKTEQTEKNSESEAKPDNEAEENNAEDKIEEKAEDKTEEKASEILNPFIAEETEGDVKVIYTNTNPGYEHDMDGFKVKVEEYQIVSVKDMHQDFTALFDDQTDGYIVTAKVNLKNETEKPIYYNNTYRIQARDQFDFIHSEIRTLIDDDHLLISKKETETSKFAAGENITGFVNFLLTNEQYETLSNVKAPKFIIEGGAADNDRYEGSYRGNAVFDFALNDKHKETLAKAPSFYQDRLTTDNMAEKKMIFEKNNIKDTKKLGEAEITLDGVQYTEITPTESYKRSFENFGDNGIVAITAKFKINNKTAEPLNLASLSTIMVIDDTRLRVLSQGMVEPRDPMEIKPGEQGEKLHVFILRKDEFELFKKFELEFGPFRGADGNELFKGRKLEFTLPR